MEKEEKIITLHRGSEFPVLLANNRVRVSSRDHIAGHKHILGLQVSVQDLCLVQVLERLRDVQCAQHTLPAVHVSRDDLGDEGGECAVRNELCDEAVMLIRHNSAEELYCVLGVDPLQDICLLAEVVDSFLFRCFELQKRIEVIKSNNNHTTQ